VCVETAGTISGACTEMHTVASRSPCHITVPEIAVSSTSGPLHRGHTNPSGSVGARVTVGVPVDVSISHVPLGRWHGGNGARGTGLTECASGGQLGRRHMGQGTAINARGLHLGMEVPMSGRLIECPGGRGCQCTHPHAHTETSEWENSTGGDQVWLVAATARARTINKCGGNTTKPSANDGDNYGAAYNPPRPHTPPTPLHPPLLYQW
jgi:hypothetical protein